MSENAESFESVLKTGDSQLDTPSLQTAGPQMAVLNQPKLVTVIDPASPEEIMLANVRAEFMQRMQETQPLRPVGELHELVSRGSLPTARLRFYPEIIVGPVNEWLHSDDVKRKALDGVRLEIADFEKFYQGRPKHESQEWLWQKLVKDRTPQSGHWK